MPKLMQISEENAEYIIRIEERLRKRPNAPGSSKRRHFERANQKKNRAIFAWSPPLTEGPKKEPRRHEARRSEDGHEDEDQRRFTWRPDDSRPYVEPPRPPDWKPLVLTPQLVQRSDEAERKLADQRLKEWSKDREGYAEQQFQEVEKRKAESGK
jgi:hypothetical protein